MKIIIVSAALNLGACGGYCETHPNASQCYAPANALCNNLTNADSIACVVAELNKASACKQFDIVDENTLKVIFSGQLVKITFVKAITLTNTNDTSSKASNGQETFGALHIGAETGASLNDKNIEIQIVNDGNDDLLADTSSIILHELGHALDMVYNGSGSHSNDSNSIMYASVQPYITPSNLTEMVNDLKNDYISCNGPWANTFKNKQ